MPRLPDFIIAGAMKCGTTWLHDALNAIDGVVIPRDEVHWLDAHDPLSHPDFHSVTRAGLRLRRKDETRWFHNPYPEAEGARLFGYDSTTLFHAHIDLGAVASALPDTKVVVLLRDPVARMMSHYWHLVRTGRCRYRFEAEILHGRQEIFHRSLYAGSAARMRAAFGDRVLFVCYEKLFTEPEHELARIAEFLTLPDGAVEIMRARMDIRSNPGRYPRFLPGWLFMSRLLSGLERGRYALDVLPPKDRGGKARVANILYSLKLGAMALAALGVNTKSRKMKARTRSELSMFLAEANTGLDDIVGQNFSSYWTKL